MSQIIEKMRQEIIDRSARFEEQTKGTKDEYNIYREHIQYVHKYVVMLSKDKNVDREVLELAALLLDIINEWRENDGLWQSVYVRDFGRTSCRVE